jgi:hypothetical protein
MKANPNLIKSSWRFMHKVWRIIIVVLQVGAVKKKYVAAVQVLRKKERQDETQFTTKIGGKTNLDPNYFIPTYTFDALLC